MKLTSLQNPRIKAAAKLRDRRGRDKAGLTLLEGYRDLIRAFEFGMEITECYYCPAMFLGENEFPLLERLKSAGVQVFEVDDHVLRKLAYRDRPEGLIAVAKIRKHLLENIPAVENGLYLVAEAVEKPGNLGSMLRSADAAGCDGLIICDKCTDIYNPNVIRASTGALFSVPLAEADSEPALAWFRKNNIKIFAATPHTDNIYTETDLSGGCALLLGTEQYGLSDFWMNNADVQIRIPMHGKIDSLNVATAATVMLFEAARQREKFKLRVKNSTPNA